MAENKQTACSSCGRTDLMLVTFVHETTGAKHHLCILCEKGTSAAQQKRSVASYDKELKEYKEMAEQIGELLGSMPSDMTAFEGLESLMVTPLSAFRSIQFKIAQLESERAAALVAEGGEVYLKAEIERAVTSGNFEKATELQKKLAKLQKK